jgi:uncharacterized repeat protein (TIGR01451 family)
MMKNRVPWLLVVVLAGVSMIALILWIPGTAQAGLPIATEQRAAQRALGARMLGVKREAATQQGESEVLANLPLRFVPNTGQDDPAVHFTVQGPGHTLFFTEEGVVFSTAGQAGGQSLRSAVGLRFLGADRRPTIEGLAPMRGVVNYFLGNDPAGWRANVPTYGAVAYRNLYPGIDLVYRGTEGNLKSEFLLAPGASPSMIQMVYSGAESLCLAQDGALLIQTTLGELVETAPLIYQQVEGVRRTIPGGFVLQSNDRVGFWVGAYDPAFPLVIDPALAYSSYLGGSGDDFVWDIVLDDAGNIYVAGQTTSTDFPTHNAMYVTPNGGQDAFVTQILKEDGVYTYSHSTYLGGSADDVGWSVGVDGQGNVYVAGQTASDDFPTRNALDATQDGTDDAFVTKIISVSGAYTLTFSTYLGGSANDGWATNLAVDDAGNAYISGSTWSWDFPTHKPLRPSLNGPHDAFVTQIISAGGVYTYAFSTYWGGSSYELGYGIDVDSAGNIYVAGDTWSWDFPTRNPTQPTYAGTPNPTYGGDAFVTKIISTGGAYDYAFSTFLGGTDSDEATRIAADDAGNIYVTGRTFSTDLPSHNAMQPACNTGYPIYDAYATGYINEGGAYSYAFSSYLCGTGSEYGQDIIVDSGGKVYVVGATASADFPITPDAWEPVHQGGSDVYVTQIVSASGVYTYAYSTFLGGTGGDLGRAIVVDSAGNMHVAGETTSTDFPVTVNALQPTHGQGTYDGFVSVLAPLADLWIANYSTPDFVAPGQTLTYSLVYANDGSGVAAGVRISDVVPVTLTNVSFDSAGAEVTPVGDVIYAWDVAPLPAGAGGVITVTGVVSPYVTGMFTLTNKAVITTTEAYFRDDDMDDNVAVAYNIVDDVPPQAPSLVSPPDGAVLTDTTPTLTWEASASADVAGYLLDLSGVEMDVGDVTEYTTAILAPGSYTWTVAAYDAVFNLSPYPESWSFTVESPNFYVYLPVVLRERP